MPSAACSASLRLASERDIPAILSLLLTSFRQFPLFNELYAPLRHDLDRAHDTIFFWRRRVLLGLLDPAATIVVAEVPAEQTPTLAASEEDTAEGIEAQSWRMLDWVVRCGGLSQRSKETGAVVVGFAIWRVRGRTKPRVGWIPWLRRVTVNLELSVYNTLYSRKDQDRARYKSYLESEELLEERFYSEACYYLDNLCVDFRYQRLGIGTDLLKQGLERARLEKLPVSTEAGPMGVGLYTKLGFKEAGVWRVCIPDGQDIEMPVMKLPMP